MGAAIAAGLLVAAPRAAVDFWRDETGAGAGTGWEAATRGILLTGGG